MWVDALDCFAFTVWVRDNELLCLKPNGFLLLLFLPDLLLIPQVMPKQSRKKLD